MVAASVVEESTVGRSADNTSFNGREGPPDIGGLFLVSGAIYQIHASLKLLQLATLFCSWLSLEDQQDQQEQQKQQKLFL